MSKAALLNYVADERRGAVYHLEDGVTRIETRQDVTHIEKAASIIADQTPGKDFRHAALIPNEVINQAMLDGWFHDPKAWKKWANDPANDGYRTWKGRL
jgi:hypothetical protein